MIVATDDVATVPDERGERVGLRIDEGHQRTCDDRVALAVYYAGVQWLVVRRNPDCDWAVDTLRHGDIREKGSWVKRDAVEQRVESLKPEVKTKHT